jgi:DNA-binding MarR family transcriptional regulator
MPRDLPTPSPARTALASLDAALLDVRRLGRRPGYRSRLLAAVGDAIDISTVRVLRAVERGHGGGEGDGGAAGICVGDVATRLEVDPSTASRLVDQQVTAGYLERQRSATDRRRSTLTLTDAGRTVLAEVTGARLDLFAEVTADWSEHEVATLATALDRLRLGFARIEDAADDEAADDAQAPALT